MEELEALVYEETNIPEVTKKETVQVPKIVKEEKKKKENSIKSIFQMSSINNKPNIWQSASPFWVSWGNILQNEELFEEAPDELPGISHRKEGLKQEQT